MPLFRRDHPAHVLGFLVISVLTMTNASKILFLSGFSVRSHMNYIWPIIENLQLRGHQLTVISPFIDVEKYPNISQTELTETKNDIEEKLDQMMDLSKKGIYHLVSFELNYYKTMGNLFYNHPAVKEIIKKKPHYDLLMVDAFYNEYVLPVAYLLNTPIVYIVTSPLDIVNTFITNIPNPFSYVPVGFVMLPEKSTFFQRLINCFAHTVGIFYSLLRIQMTDYIVSTYIPDAPSLDEVRKNISLVIVNSNPVTDNPRPILPNVISTGCLQCRAAKPLPQHLEDFIQSSGEHGFILFSLGSIMKGNSWPENSKKAFIRAFSKLKQKIIWKYDETIDGLSDNVMLMKWVPQQDILGHPKIRLFIGHGGHLGIQEAVYHGVPILGMPMFAMQPQHIARAVDMGFGESMDFFQVTEEELLHKIKLILNNQRYKTTVSRHSNFSRELPEFSIERAVLWIEYVIHHKGAYHLLPSVRHLSTLQYFLIDILSVITAVVLLCILCCYCILKWIFFKSKKTKKSKND